MFKNRDMKNYRAREESEGTILVRMTAYLIIAVLLAVLAWMGERDHQHKLDQLREAAQCGSSTKQVKQ
ncbi:hypothetical protein [Nitrosomonas supralitoralis]|uniref:Uncharacterized protein n=1 Tax=Nitrosomonas supralitoralis TaxID=2116706 RepID=A0A2P7NS97_9PROT|nr:hypothetical protein [Nitrosomonas supralitoralis]PSJ16344.1 hypothetical protein C7H79_13875 [Nitrosomonas supralitoralis]